ncbi:MAG: hypothetical protein ABIP53_02955 [Candidatus Limnocylindrales bacterium]
MTSIVASHRVQAPRGGGGASADRGKSLDETTPDHRRPGYATQGGRVGHVGVARLAGTFIGDVEGDV